MDYYSRDLYLSVEKVDDVSRKDNIEEHFRSVMNIQTDASNLERINRWQSALRMFKDRPFTGFGPGTNMFVYGQLPGNFRNDTDKHQSWRKRKCAHSEYLMYLSESGSTRTIHISGHDIYSGFHGQLIFSIIG